ncbi:MAG: hypothetical protein JWL92_56 [Candidatus Nomurabacteria bacterium]|nr:hypothetical protein [Candidatus Nomurabacteria bacterium]
MELELWENNNGRCYVAEFIRDQGKERALEIESRLQNLQTATFSSLIRSQKIKKLQGEIYEIRLKIKGLQYRFLFILKHDTGIIVEAFIKKSQKLPMKHLEAAKKRVKEII